MPSYRTKIARARKKEKQSGDIYQPSAETLRAKLCDPNTWFTFLLTVFTAGLVVIGWLQRNTMEKADDTSRQYQRAWVGLDGEIIIGELQTSPTLHIEASYKIRNFGTGPAVKVISSEWFVTERSEAAEVAKFACETSIGFATGTVPRGPGVKNPGPMGYTLFPNQIKDGYIGRPNDPWKGPGMQNVSHIKFIGCIAYIDQFSKVHWSRFCMENDISYKEAIDRAVRLSFCSLYNDTDESETNKN